MRRDELPMTWVETKEELRDLFRNGGTCALTSSKTRLAIFRDTSGQRVTVKGRVFRIVFENAGGGAWTASLAEMPVNRRR